jgi:tryptophan 2,3-dioxygenase
MANGPEQPSAYGEGDLTYEDYLKVTELLDLQEPRSDPEHHDEMLFIIIHQAYELWFKLIRHELDSAMESMREGEVLRARPFVARIVEVLDLLVDQIHILETMEPVEFLQFRDRLAPASGFQSVQFREIEFACGLKDDRYLEFLEGEAADRLAAKLEEPDLRTTYYGMLGGRDTGLPKDPTHEALDGPLEADAMEALRELYMHPDDNLPLYLLTESLMELDETMGLWREHHVRVVERIIGHKRGTGGSSGVGYLKSTTDKRCFPHIWNVRTYLEGDASDAGSPSNLED